VTGIFQLHVSDFSAFVRLKMFWVKL